MFSVGAAYQYATLEGDQVFPATTHISKTFTNILPELMWRKKLSAKSNLRVFYRGSTNEPSITQLQNVINNNNPLYITTGNPDLQQQYTHRLVTRYSFTNSTKASSFFANLFIEKTDDYIGNLIYFCGYRFCSHSLRYTQDEDLNFLNRLTLMDFGAFAHS